MFGIYIYRDYTGGTESIYKACTDSMNEVNRIISAFDKSNGSEKGYKLRVIAGGKEIIKK